MLLLNFKLRKKITNRKYSNPSINIGKKFNAQGTKEEKMCCAAEFHIQMRVLQLSFIRDPIYGYTSPFFVFSHDQVPLGSLLPHHPLEQEAPVDPLHNPAVACFE